MTHPLLETAAIKIPPGDYLHGAGAVFAEFHRSQDSGNWSYGVEVAGERFFVKTAGDPTTEHAILSHADRVALLRNGARLYASCPHPLLPPLLAVVESLLGPMLVYRWAEGELLHARGPEREDPASAFQRFRLLLAATICGHLGAIFELHVALAQAGWVAHDFYDGCLIYDFAADRLAVIDLDTYNPGPFINTMGRMFGSTRFMAPEEFEFGALIDERTNVFTMGRTALLLLGDGTRDPTAFRGPPAAHAVAARACEPERARRYATLAELHAAWGVSIES
ncbi:MAG: hypothetical protein RLZZ387_2220 [Chloroflexota bacterium]|jgi:serine/threonine-protein kinase